jgi:hypothetical protein
LQSQNGGHRLQTIKSWLARFADAEALEQAGKDGYFLMTQDPIVVIRFSKLPGPAQLDLVKKAVSKATQDIGNSEN